MIYYSRGAARSTGSAAADLNIDEHDAHVGTWYNPASSGRPLRQQALRRHRDRHAGDERGVVAVDPKVIPLGTRLYIPGYGFAVAADTGGGIKGNMVDLGYPDGVQSTGEQGWVDVYILAP